MSIIDNGVPCWHVRWFIARCRKNFPPPPPLTDVQRIIKNARAFCNQIDREIGEKKLKKKKRK
jgi:hypothetical protein